MRLGWQSNSNSLSAHTGASIGAAYTMPLWPPGIYASQAEKFIGTMTKIGTGFPAAPERLPDGSAISASIELSITATLIQSSIARQRQHRRSGYPSASTSPFQMSGISSHLPASLASRDASHMR